MTSTEPAANNAKTPNFGRRIKWLGVFAAFLMVAWTGGWFYLARLGEEQVDLALANANKGGQNAVCDSRLIKGYPFRFGLFCDSVALDQLEKGVRVSAGALRTAAQVYNPWHLVAELDGPASIEVPGMEPLDINWSLLHSSVRANRPLPDRVSIEAKDLEVSLKSRPGLGNRVILSSYAAGHMRKEDKDTAFAGEVDNLMIDPVIVKGRDIPALSVSYDAVLTDGVRILAATPKNIRAVLRGASGQIRSATLTFKEGGAMTLSGPLSVDASGFVDGDITLKFTDGEKLGAALARALPEAASVIEPSLAAAAMAAGKDKEATLTLTIRKGKISAGFFPIGNIPPI
jgi:hypothetical protein